MGIANLRVVVDNTQKEFDEKNKWVSQDTTFLMGEQKSIRQ